MQQMMKEKQNSTLHSAAHLSTAPGIPVRTFLFRLFILVGSVFLITLFHYLTATQQAQFHDIYRRLYYLPIILSGIWFRTGGGFLTAFMVSLLYAPHVIFQWEEQAPKHLDQYLEIFLYNVVGLLTGLLSEKEWLQRKQLAKTAHDLEHSYAHLKEQAEIILGFEEQLVKASRLSALGELSASLAHEIRNPLGSIRGTAEILSDADQTVKDRAEFGRILIKETNRLNEVLENFLQFAASSPVGKDRFDLHETLDELLALTRPECERLNLSISLDQGELPTIPGNKSQMKQVFLNFILNAAQAIDSVGHLEIKTCRSGNNAMIQFKDNGSGIPEEYMSEIFEPFFTTKSEGVGLGLAITYRIVKAHGGHIDVESCEQDGTTFNVSLPIHTT